MRYSVVPISLLFGFLLLIAPAARSSDIEKKTFKTPNGERFTIEHPSGWTSEIQTNTGLSMATFRLSNQETSSVLMVSIIPSSSGLSIDNMNELEQILINGTKPMARDSVEKKVRTLSFKSEHAYGVYATFSDAKLASRAPLLGEFRSASTFILNCAGHTVTATFVTNDDVPQAVDLAVMILRTLHREAESSRAEAK